jgi:hypothetical protein
MGFKNSATHEVMNSISAHPIANRPIRAYLITLILLSMETVQETEGMDLDPSKDQLLPSPIKLPYSEQVEGG